VGSTITPDQWCMFCTPSYNIFHMLLSTGFKSCELGDHSWGGINSGVFLSNNAIVARAWWAFQVSQGSVETLFRWGGKRLHHVVANLFRKLCAKFHHNCPSFVGDITENILVSFFSGHGVFFIFGRIPEQKYSRMNWDHSAHCVKVSRQFALNFIWHH